MGEESKLYTLAEVSQHNNSKDCWLVIAGKVYDVTKFLDNHPGGDDAILSSTGKDATDDFEDVGHSNSAKKMLKDFYIGDFDMATITKKVENNSSKQPQFNQEMTSNSTIKIFPFLIPLFILGLAFGIRFYTKST